MRAARDVANHATGAGALDHLELLEDALYDYDHTGERGMDELRKDLEMAERVVEAAEWVASLDNVTPEAKENLRAALDAYQARQEEM